MSYPEDLEVSINQLYITGGGHLAFSQEVSRNDSMIMIGNIHGDRSGMLHTSAEQAITIQEGDAPFPAAIRVYERSQVILPSGE